MNRKLVLCLSLTLIVPALCRAHHGVAAVGAVGLEGPGAPIEASSAAPLPAGRWFGYLKLDHARFRTFTAARDDEVREHDFWMLGLGYGLRSWCSLYAFVPFNVKVSEDNGYNTAGFADPSLFLVLAFAGGNGWHPVPRQESLDDLEDLHLALYGGTSLPLGRADLRDASGSIDPGMSLGFGEPAVTLGTSLTKLWADRWTGVLDVSTIRFREHTYADGHRTRFGNEWHLNLALARRLVTRAASGTRWDAVLELDGLRIGRDVSDGVPETATGGTILYLLPGLRLFKGPTSVACGVKVPLLKDLNEQPLQQGSEGTEHARLILTWSVLW